MIRLAKQMYDYYVKPVLGEKGQDLVEYALLLAIIVGIGYLIYSQKSLGTNIENIFTDGNDLLKAQKNELNDLAK